MNGVNVIGLHPAQRTTTTMAMAMNEADPTPMSALTYQVPMLQPTPTPAHSHGHAHGHAHGLGPASAAMTSSASLTGSAASAAVATAAAAAPAGPSFISCKCCPVLCPSVYPPICTFPYFLLSTFFAHRPYPSTPLSLSWHAARAQMFVNRLQKFLDMPVKALRKICTSI